MSGGTRMICKLCDLDLSGECKCGHTPANEQLERDGNGFLKEVVRCEKHCFTSWVRSCPYCKVDQLESAIAFICDDSIAMTYQTMRQYRTAVLNVLEGKTK